MTNEEIEELDNIINDCLNNIYNETDDETSNKLDNNKKLVEESVKNENKTITFDTGSVLKSSNENIGPSLIIHENKNDNKNKEEEKTTQSLVEGQIKWDQEVIDLFNEKFPNKDIYNMSLEDLKHLRDDVEALREEYSLIEQAYKVLSNAAYGASANAKGFYFYNLAVAGDITGECRALTKYFWTHLEKFFHEDIWKRKDLWKKFGFELDESKHDLCRSLPVSCYSDTDSVDKDSFIYIKEIIYNKNKEIIATNYNTYTFNNFWNYLCKVKHCTWHKNENGQKIIAVPDNIFILNWTKKNGLFFTPMKYIMQHYIDKDIYRITSESGKTVEMTGDHSLIVLRNNCMCPVKPKDIKIETDKIITVNTDKL